MSHTLTSNLILKLSFLGSFMVVCGRVAVIAMYSTTPLYSFPSRIHYIGGSDLVIFNHIHLKMVSSFVCSHPEMKYTSPEKLF